MKTSILVLKRIIRFTCFLNLCVLTVSAQATFEKTWSGNGANEATSVYQLPDGGFIIAGTSGFLQSISSQMFLLRTNANGDTMWTRKFVNGGYCTAYGLAVIPTGGYILTGMTSSSLSTEPDALVIRTDTAGNVRWTNTFGGIYNDGIRTVSVSSTPDHGLIMTGWYGSNASLDYHVLLVKMDSAGTTTWAKTISAPESVEGSAAYVAGNGYIVFGYGADRSSDLFLMKTNSLGVPTWNNIYGGRSYDDCLGGTPTHDGGFLIAGTSFNDSLFFNQVLLIRTDSLGHTVWEQVYQQEDMFVNSIKETRDHGFILTGYISDGFDEGNLLLMKIDSTGQVTWANSFGDSGFDYGNDVIQTSDSGFIVVGTKDNSYGTSGDIFIVRTDLNGQTGCENALSIVNFEPPHSDSSVAVANAAIAASGAVNLSVGRGFSKGVLCPANSIDELSDRNHRFEVFPNPSNGTFTIRSNVAKEKNIHAEFLNITGETLWEKNFSSGNILVRAQDSGAQLAAGIYYLRLFSEEGCETLKILVRP